MFSEIYKFAINNNLVPSNYFKPRLISGYILLNENSKYIGIELCDKKNKVKTLCPDIGSLAFSGANCNPIVEKSSYILDKTQQKHIGFKNIMLLASQNNHLLQIVYEFLNNLEENKDLTNDVITELSNLKIKESDFLSFKVNGIALEENNEFKSWFVEYMESKKNTSDEEIISILSGKKVKPLLKTAPMIKEPSSLVGTGVYISSFASDSFQSYGLKKNLNMPIGEEEAKILVAGFEYLLSNDKHFDKDFGLIHFYDDNIISQVLNPMDDFYDDEVDNSKNNINVNSDVIFAQNLQVPRTGDNINEEISNDIFQMMQFVMPSGTKGRFYLSKYKKGSCKTLQDNILKWKQDSTLDSVIKKDNKYIQISKPIGKLYSIFYAILEDKKATDKIAQIEKEFGTEKINLLYSIVDDQQIPIKIFNKAVLTTKKAMVNGENLDVTAMKIIKAYLTRKQRMKGETISIMPYLNENETNIAYNCGRLFAIYEILQKTAMGTTNSTIAKSYFPSAQSNPGLVFGRLAKLSNYHLDKLNEKPQFKTYYSKQIQDIANKIPEYPKKLNLEEQGTFALGYYHQKHEIYKSKQEEKGEE